MESFNFEQYKVARCYVAISDEYSDLLKAEIKKTNGKACENGCPSNNNHNCPPYKLLISTKPFSEAQPNINENVREEAIRLGISLSECRRRRSGR